MKHHSKKELDFKLSYHLIFRAKVSDILRLQSQNGSLPDDSMLTILNQTQGPGYSWSPPPQPYAPSNFTPSNSTPDISLMHREADQLMQMYLVAMSLFMGGISLFGLAYFRMSVIIGKKLHNAMFEVVIGSKTYFFDSNPVGEELLSVHMYQCTLHSHLMTHCLQSLRIYLDIKLLL